MPYKILLFGIITCVLTACGISFEREDGAPVGASTAKHVPNAIPRKEARSRYGNPESYVVLGKRYYTFKESSGYVQTGIASWYGKKFHGRKTSSGEVYDMYAMTAAHKRLPLPSYVEVSNIENGKRIVVRVNDRGPFHENRIIDLSYTAAQKLGIVGKGTGMVEIRAVSSPGQLRTGQDQQASLYEQGYHAWLQLGAFSERRNAELLFSKLHPVLSDKVRISESSKTGLHLFRVQVGPLLNVDVSDKMVQTLTSLGVYEYYYVFE